MMPDKELNIQIRVTDPNPSNYDTATLKITVTDVNDNAPIITPSSSTRTIMEDVPVGTFIANFSATDIDEGVNAQFE